MNGSFSVTAGHDQFCQHRVKIVGNAIALVEMGIHPDTGTGRQSQSINCSHRRTEVRIRILACDSAFNRPTALLNVLLLESKLIPVGHLELLTHQINAGDLFSHGMLYLETSVDFEEIKVLVFVNQKFEGSGVVIAHRKGTAHGSLSHGLTRFRIQERTGGLFQHLLKAALNTALSFQKINRLTVFVGQNLNLNMARLGDILFEIDAVVTERG